MPSDYQKDNSTFMRKVALRRRALVALTESGATPIVLESHGGYGALWRQCYQEVPTGCVLEKDLRKALHLALQRPTWAVYQGESTAALAAGAGNHLPVNFLDLDPYGDPWPVLHAFLAAPGRPTVPTLHIVVNDGMRLAMRRKGGAGMLPSMQAAAQRFGSDLHQDYLEVCEVLMAEEVAQAGYRLSHWTGYYCGHNDLMTHYHAICAWTGVPEDADAETAS